MSLFYDTIITSTTGTTPNSIVSTPSIIQNTTTIPQNSVTIGTISDLYVTPQYYLKPKIEDINVYGHDKPKVVEVEFRYGYDTTKIKAICCDEDEFDLKKGVYIAMSKLLYSDEYTTEGIEEKAHELSLKKENEKMVNKAIKEYHRKLRIREEAKMDEEKEKAAKLKRKEKNEEKKRKRKERNMDDLARLIKKAMSE